MNSGNLHPVHDERPRWQWKIIFPASAIGLVFGTIGFHHYECNGQSVHGVVILTCWLTSLYHACQLFVLHTPLFDKPLHWTLEVGRWAAAIAFGLTAVFALYGVFWTEWRLIAVGMRRGHIVVCGLGRFGLPLAIQFKRMGKRVVAIESHACADAIAQARNHGITVLVGDARSPSILRQVHVSRAHCALAVCSDDGTNTAIAMTTAALIYEQNGEQGLKTGVRRFLEAPFGQRSIEEPAMTTCWILVEDFKTRAILSRQDIFPKVPGFRVNVGGLNPFEFAARKAFEEHPLDIIPIQGAMQEEQVHLVLIGFDRMGQALALQAARIGHFINDKKVRITILGVEVESRWEEFKEKYKEFENICNVKMMNSSLDASSIESHFNSLYDGKEVLKDILTVAVCLEKDGLAAAALSSGLDLPVARDSFNLALATTIAPLLKNETKQILVYFDNRNGFNSLFDRSMFPNNDTLPESLISIYPFGMVEDICTDNVLNNEDYDNLAKCIHQAWLEEKEKQRENDPTVKVSPAEKPWQLLDEEYVISNRQAADHIPVKIKSLGYSILSKQNFKQSGVEQVTEFKDADVERLSRLEHSRWGAERWLAGWQHGPERNDNLKIHNWLLPWEKLPDEARKLDAAQVNKIIDALDKVGKVVCREAAVSVKGV